MPHPVFFSAPAVSRVVGREAELLSLWQNLLLGRRAQAIVGPDGIGKSTIAVEFCDRARRSGRFTCIRWFDAGSVLQSELFDFFQSMRGRKEKDVLLVIDNTTDPQGALRLVPEHANVYTLLTTSAHVDSSTTISIVKATPLSPETVAQFSGFFEAKDLTSTALGDVLSAVGFVPLLVRIVCSLIESGAVSPEELKEVLRRNDICGHGALSVSHALSVLLETALAALEARRPGGTRVLLAIALFDTRSLSYAVVDSLIGNDSGEEFAMEAARLGICDQRWDEPSLTFHPSIAHILRNKADDVCLAECGRALLSLWPRRWRGAGSSVARELTRHTRAICESSDALRIPLGDDLLVSLDRAATLLAFHEGKQLPTAAELWLRVVRANQSARRRDAEAVRVARECGRLLHFLRDARAHAVLRDAFELSCAVYGKQSAEAALILGCYAPYLPASREALRTLRTGVASLENRAACGAAVLGREEERMLRETVFVLLLREGQMLGELREEVPAALWTSLQEAEERIKQTHRPEKPKK